MRQHRGVGQHRGLRGQAGEQPPGHDLELAHVAPIEPAQERPERGGCPDPAEQLTHPTVAQHVEVVDGVRPGQHAGHDPGDLQVRVHADRDPHVQVLGDQAGQVAVLGQAHHRDQPGAGHEIRVIKLCGRVLGAVQQSHPADALRSGCMGSSQTPSSQVRGHLPCHDTINTHIRRWIQAEVSPRHIRGTTECRGPATRRPRARHPYLSPPVRSLSRTIADVPCGRPVVGPVTASAACPSRPRPNLALVP